MAWNFCKSFPEKLTPFHSFVSDINNADETEFFYKTYSKVSLMQKNASVHGFKKFKKRFIKLLTASWSGEK